MAYVLFEDLAEKVRQFRILNKSIVLTSGVFDLLNLGHLYYLEDAALLGDVLIVGVDCDELVKKFKGPSRPYNQESDRAVLLAGLRPVKLVTIFSQITALIEAVKPDVFVMSPTTGTLPQNRPESKLVVKLGGRVEVISSRYQLHTTDLLSAMQKDAKKS